jgi:hypothetical protein
MELDINNVVLFITIFGALLMAGSLSDAYQAQGHAEHRRGEEEKENSLRRNRRKRGD